MAGGTHDNQTASMRVAGRITVGWLITQKTGPLIIVFVD